MKNLRTPRLCRENFGGLRDLRMIHSFAGKTFIVEIPQKCYNNVILHKNTYKEEVMNGTTLGIFAIIVVYILGMVGIGVWFSKRTTM